MIIPNTPLRQSRDVFVAVFALVFTLLFTMTAEAKTFRFEPLPKHLTKCTGGTDAMPPDQTKLDFWKTRRAGANLFNHVMSEKPIEVAASYGIDFLRIAVAKSPGTKGKFLIGDIKNYHGLVEADMRQLEKLLDAAEDANMPVVLVMLRLPGAPWPQMDGSRVKQPLWNSARYWDQSIDFWKDLAARLAPRRGIVAYNLLNEPRPEQESGLRDLRKNALDSWARKARGTTADLNQFYRCLTDAIRKVDPSTPIMLDAGIYASVKGFRTLKPLPDPAILYAMHSYYPSEYTSKSKNKWRYAYPGKIRIDGKEVKLDRALINKHLRVGRDWAKSNHIPAWRMVLAEFGVNRRVEGAGRYIDDVISSVDRFGWHWAVYAFREDRWHEMDYELGSKRLPDLSDDLSVRTRTLDAMRSPRSDYDALWRRFAR